MINIKHNTDILSQEILEQTPEKTSSTGTRESFIQETLYQTKAYENKDKDVVSFSLHNQHYGKLNNDLLSIIPNTERSATISPESDLRLLDFVADAYFAFLQELEFFKVSNKFSPNSKVYNFQATGDSESLDQKYDLFLQDQYSFFLDFVNNRNLNKNIFDIDSFISVFASFIDSRTPTTPYNKSSFLYSNRVSRKITGLVVDLDLGDSNDDLNKVENYISSEDFECFQDLASSFGFVVNKDIPWQLVADLNSVNMKFYFHLKMLDLVAIGTIDQNPVPTTSRNFENCKDILENFDLANFLLDQNQSIEYYKIVNYDDLNNLKNIIYYFYNSFVEYSSKITNTNIIKEFNQLKIQQSTQTRKLVFREELNSNRINNIIIKLYIFIKAKEANAKWSQNNFVSVVTRARQIAKTLDTNEALRYVQKELNQIGRSKTKQTSFYF
jgi:hypothetical protein